MIFIRQKKIYIMTLLLCGCSIYTDQESMDAADFLPKPLFFTGMPKGNDSYSQGFRAGCRHFLGQEGYGLQRFLDNPRDPNELSNELYQRGYKQGGEHCGAFVNRSSTL